MKALQSELTVPPAGQAPEFTLDLVLSREHNSVLHRNLELRLGEADIGGQRYAIALVRDPRFGTLLYTRRLGGDHVLSTYD